MAKLTWDQTGEKKYENGVKYGVLYKKETKNDVEKWYGYAWNGLTSVTESPEGAEKTDLYADNIKYASFRSAETFGGTIEAYTYPPEFADCNGEKKVGGVMTVGQQKRSAFGLCYRTEQGNDEDPNFGYKLHLVYNCTCSPSERAYETINDSPDAMTLSWEFDSTPVDTGETGYNQTSLVVIDSADFTDDTAKAHLAALEAALYGTDGQNGTEPYLPTPSQVKQLLTTGSISG